MNVDAKIWNIKDGEIVELMVDDTIFVMKETVIEDSIETPLNIISSNPKTKHKSRNIKISYLQKWIQNNNFKEFTLEQFFKEYPKQKQNNRLNSNIYNLINKKIIEQLDSDKFKVIR